MNAAEQIISKQIEWANNKDLVLIGSQGVRGRKVYTTKLHENLFQPLTSQARIDLEGGDGGEVVFVQIEIISKSTKRVGTYPTFGSILSTQCPIWRSSRKNLS